jgi:hypothetical protein
MLGTPALCTVDRAPFLLDAGPGFCNRAGKGRSSQETIKVNPKLEKSHANLRVNRSFTILILLETPKQKPIHV